MYRPASAPERNAPALVFYHGGGWVIGDLDTHDGLCRHLANRSGGVVVAVDYRLAPEDPFPAAVDDAIDAFTYVAAQASTLGLDPHRIAVGGDSAGGNLAAVLAMQTSGDLLQGELSVAPSFQFLLYPWVDMSGDSDSIRRFGKGLILTEDTMRFFRNAYVPKDAESQALKTSPMLCEDMSSTPDTLVVTAEYDVLRDEGLAFVEKLQQAKVSVSHLHLPDCTHGFISTGKFSPATGRRLNEVAAMLAKYAASI